MPGIFLLDSTVTAGPTTISGEKARYLTSVLRCSPGDPLTIKDSIGNVFSARIISAGRKEVQIEIGEKQEYDTESFLHITLLQGLLKGEKMDLVIQKSTEMGVREIIPVVTERSQVRETRKLPRWRKIAEEASRQSGRNAIPTVHEAVELDNLFLLHRVPAGIIFWEQDGIPFADALSNLAGCREVALFTGPEGGFSATEVALITKNGFLAATLGRRILRAETAALAVVSIIQFALGDLGNTGE